MVVIMAQGDKENNETFEFLYKYLPAKANDTIRINEDFNINNVLQKTDHILPIQVHQQLLHVQRAFSGLFVKIKLIFQ